jgi:hypothetical protein
MLKALTKDHLHDRAMLCARLREAYAMLETAIDTYNTLIADAWMPLQAAADDYNRLVAEAQDWANDIAREIQEQIDDHNDKWQEGERGQAYMAWQSEYENITLETIKLEEPTPLALDISDQSEILDGLPEDP